MSEIRLSRRTRALGSAAKVLAAGALLVLIVLTSLAVFRLERLEKAAAEERDLIAAQTTHIEHLSVVAAACGAANPGDITATRQCVKEAVNAKETP